MMKFMKRHLNDLPHMRTEESMNERTPFEIIELIDDPKNAKKLNVKTRQYKPSEILALTVLDPLLEMIGGRIALMMQETMKQCENELDEDQVEQERQNTSWNGD